ncbi:hypothetical protein F5884DRAFT_668438 [Xylogone sp. PMI_703]|nr:hypothetical protein F5884DRAFT_668438 [Xylogone sp. PMI_703]
MAVTMIQGAWAIVAARYLEMDDVVIGNVFNDCKPESNTNKVFPIRISVDSLDCISKYLESISDFTQRLARFKDTKISEIRRLGTEISAACEFQEILAIHTRHNGSMGSSKDQSDYVLLADCYVHDQEANFEITFDENTVSRTNVEHWLHQLEFVLQQLCNKPGNTTLEDVQIFSPEDKRKIWEFNDKSFEMVHSCVHELFAEQVTLRPDEEAICSWDATFTYSELDDVSTRLSNHLVSSGVHPGNLVPFCFDKSAWAVVSMLAVLKAGGACIALDAQHPVARLQKIVQDAGSQHIIAAPQHVSLCQTLAPTVVSVDASFVYSLPEKQQAPVTSVTPQDPAFVVFTSGSTGVPKGVVLQHQAICTSGKAHGTTWDINPGTRVFQFAAYTFDVSLADNFTSLMRGACVCIPSPEDRFNNLAGAITKFNANWAFLTPSVASLVNPAAARCLSTLVLGGEAATQEVIRTWADEVDLIICYGPAEASVYCMGAAPAKITSRPEHLGKPFGCRLWIAEPHDHNRLTPIGCVGEILIEGPILAKGYLNNPEVTKRSFLESVPWMDASHDQGWRLYKTGDLAKYNNDGSISFAGRKDAQVKLRGQRVELGEIEHHISLAIPTIKGVSAQIVSPPGRAQMKVIAAFLCLADETEDPVDLPISVSEPLRSCFLAIERALIDALPSYMIPSAYIPLKTIPLTANGKLDRRKLHQIVSNLSDKQWESFSLTQSEYQGTKTDMEKTLQSLWGQILGIEGSSISANDSFFRRGGDSLKSMALVSAARANGVAITFSEIFMNPVLKHMAKVARKMTSTSLNKQAKVTPFSLVDANDVGDLTAQACQQCRVSSDAIHDIYPCVPIQNGLMALSLSSPGAYIGQLVFTLNASINVQKLQAAWTAVVQQNPILRTRIIHTANAGFMQVVTDDAFKFTKIVDCESLDIYLAHDKTIPMPYGQPLNRWSIANDKGNGTRHLIWTAHHAIYDGWTIPSIVSRVEQFYYRGVAQEALGMNVFLSHTQDLKSKDTETFWRTYLADALEPTFPVARTKKLYSITNSKVVREVGFLPVTNTDITIATMIKAAWALLVARYEDSSDAIFGMMLSGRDIPLPAIEDIMGPTLSTVPVRVKFDKSESVVDFLHRIQHQYIEMIEAATLGLQNIKDLSPSTQVATGFKNILIVQPDYSSSLRTEELPSDKIRFNTNMENSVTYPLNLECFLKGDSNMVVKASFDSDVIDSTQVSRIVGQFEHILSQISQLKPERRIKDLELISPADIADIEQWNRSIPEAVESCLHTVIEERVKIQPNSLAISAWDGDLTYKELDDLSTNLAVLLKSLGIGANTMVPFCIEKSMWALVSIIAILKAGGACVPLAVTDPLSRHTSIIEDCKARIVLVSQSFAGRFSGLLREVVIASSFVRSLPTNLADNTKSRPEDLACVLFTSGSTGRPKGVLLTHRAMCTAISQISKELGYSSLTRTYQFSSFTFDLSLSDIYCTLSSGGCLCVPSEADRLNSLAASIDDMKANFLFTTPTVSRLLKHTEVPTLQTLVIGGEPATSEDIKAWADHLKCIQIYGLTETCILNTATIVADDSDPANIGRSFTLRPWITDIDDNDKLAPIGTIGELFLEGPCQASGYLNRDDLTKKSFIEYLKWMDYTVSKGPRRLYRTGDLVRFESDGSLQYIRRKDTQVKLRGLRVELGEVEHHLRKYLPAANKVVVDIITPLHEKESMLGAFIFISRGEIDTKGDIILTSEHANREAGGLIEGLREKLAIDLPPHMIPTAYIPISRIPLTLAGKTDRKSLRHLASQVSIHELCLPSSSSANSLKPRVPLTPMETKLLALWKQILRIDDSLITSNSSFFAMGGSSLSAIHLVAQAGEANIGISVVDIFQYPTLGEMASNAKLLVTEMPVKKMKKFSLLKNKMRDGRVMA